MRPITDYEKFCLLNDCDNPWVIQLVMFKGYPQVIK